MILVSVEEHNDKSLSLSLSPSLSSSGRGFQVRGENRMHWNKINTDHLLKAGDVVGCGWLKEDTPTNKGVVYFTVNNIHLEQTFKDSPTGLYPFIHVQKKVSFKFVFKITKNLIHVCTCTCIIFMHN